MSAVSRQREWQLRHPEKARAQAVTQRALASGDLVRPDTCSRCPNPNPHAHHEDYSRPLDVMWLCQACHIQRHVELRAPALEARRAARRAEARRVAERNWIERRKKRSIADVLATGDWITQRYTEADLIAALQDVAVDGYLSRKMYIERRASQHPSPAMFDIRFGTWTAAVEAAGLRAGRRLRDYERMTDEKLVADVRCVVEATAWLPSIAEYDRFRRAHPEHGMACSTLVRRRLGGWAECLRLATEENLDRRAA